MTDDNRIIRYDVNTWKSVDTMRVANEPTHFTYSPDGNTIATYGRGRVYLYDMETLQRIWDFSFYYHKASNVALEFSPDGRYLMAMNHQVDVIDVETLEEVYQLQ